MAAIDEYRKSAVVTQRRDPKKLERDIMTNLDDVGLWIRDRTTRLRSLGIASIILIASVMSVAANPRSDWSLATQGVADVLASPVPAVEDPNSNNLVRNGGFEEDLAYWSVEGQAVPSTRSPHQGRLSLRVGSAEGYAGQRLPIEPGKTYRLSVWGSVDAGGDVGYVGVTFRNATGERLSDREPQPLAFTKREYLPQSLEFSIDESVSIVTLFVFKESGPARFFVDEISVMPLDSGVTPGFPVASPAASPQAQ